MLGGVLSRGNIVRACAAVSMTHVAWWWWLEANGCGVMGIEERFFVWTRCSWYGYRAPRTLGEPNVAYNLCSSLASIFGTSTTHAKSMSIHVMETISE